MLKQKERVSTELATILTGDYAQHRGQLVRNRIKCHVPKLDYYFHVVIKLLRVPVFGLHDLVHVGIERVMNCRRDVILVRWNRTVSI
jgi:hypothetical protein